MRLGVAALVAVLLAPASAAAQSISSDTPISAEAEQELRCGMWAAFMAGRVEDPELQKALGFALTYWVGRFEGMTGLDFDQVATVEFVSELEGKLDDLRLSCAPKMEAMGDRMRIWGERMQNVGSAEPTNAAP
jgi:hypothetical protein